MEVELAGGRESQMLKMEDMANRPDFRFGALSVSPSRRRVEGPAGEAHLEPRIMQIFLLLLDARGEVVTRNVLFDQCWGSEMVGDDSINRAVARIRSIAREIAPGLLEIETIPRTGYRLTGAPQIHGPGATETQEPSLDRGSTPAQEISRRVLVGGGLAAAGAAAGASFWWMRSTSDPRVAALMADGRQALREGWPASDKQGVDLFRRAVAIEPNNAEAWGLLAVALRNVAEQAAPAQTSAAVRTCEAAARRALALNPQEANALAALAMLQPEFGNWGETENRLRKVLAVAPDNLTALNHMVLLLQSVGKAQESWDLNERAVALDPLSPVHQYRRALKLWIFGRVQEADLTIDRTLQLWPRHPAVWNARLYIFAFTGRADAALALVGDAASRPNTLAPAAEKLWRTSLVALHSRTPDDIAVATRANLEAAPRSPGFAVKALMVLSMLGEIDAAFSIAEGFLLRKGRLIGTLWTGSGQMPVNDQHWRRTMNLFTPATAAMRADARFENLCDGIGLIDYWRKSGTGPDPMFKIA